jgi:AraC-like DNA-binding protein
VQENSLQSVGFTGRDPQDGRTVRYSDVRELSASRRHDEDLGGEESLLEAPPRSNLINAGLERLLSGAAVSTEASHQIAVIVVRGVERLTADGQEHTLRSGDVAFVPKGIALNERTDGRAPVDRLVVAFSSAESEAEPFFITRDTAGRLRELAAWLVTERRATFQGSAVFRERALELLLAELRRLQADGCSVLERQTRAYVLDHMSQSITLQELASNVGMSRHYFCRLYHRLTGESPMTTVRNLKLERARELVLTTDLSLRAIAGEVGFSSQYHLSRVLRSHFGVGMKELRAAARRSAQA